MTRIIDELQRDLFQLQAVLAAAGIALDEGTPKQYREKICWCSLFDVVNGLTLKALHHVETLQDSSDATHEYVAGVPEGTATAATRREQLEDHEPAVLALNPDYTHLTGDLQEKGGTV